MGVYSMKIIRALIFLFFFVLPRPVLGTIYRVEKLVKNNLEIYLLSDLHDRVENNRLQAQELLEVIKQYKPILIIEDPFENHKEQDGIFAYSNNQKISQLTTVLTQKMNKLEKTEKSTTPLGLIGLTEPAREKGATVISVDSHRIDFDVIRNFLAHKSVSDADNEGLKLFSLITLYDYIKTLNSWFDKMKAMKGELAEKYRSLNSILFGKQIPINTENSSLIEHIKKHTATFNKFTSLYENAFLEMKALNIIDKHKTDKPIFIYLGGYHVEKIRKVLQENCFKTSKEEGVDTDNPIKQYELTKNCKPVVIKDFFPEPSIRAKLHHFWFNHRNKIQIIFATIITGYLAYCLKKIFYN